MEKHEIASHGKYLGFSLVLNQALTIGAHLSPNTSNELVKFMLPLCLRHFLQVSITPSVSPPSSMFLSFALHPPHLLQTELGAIHNILHLPPQTISYSFAINLSPLSGFNIRSACTAMNASMIRLALKSFPQAKEMNEILLQTTLEHVPLGFVGRVRGFPDTPGWDSHAFVSNLVCALRHDIDLGAGVPEFAAFIRKIKCKIERNFLHTRGGDSTTVVQYAYWHNTQWMEFSYLEEAVRFWGWFRSNS